MELLRNSLKPSTSIAYQRILNDFCLFLDQHNIVDKYIPASMYTIALYISHLYKLGRQYSTIRSCVSALSFVHKLAGYEDPTTSFLVTKTLQGIANTLPARLSRLPITKAILEKILGNIKYCTQNHYDRVMFRALFLLSYSACLRAGEAVQSHVKDHTLQMSQITSKYFQIGRGYEIKFNSYKHSSGHSPSFNLLPTGDSLCPVDAIQSYLRVRGSSKGPIFCNKKHKPLTRIEFSNFLKETLEMAGFNGQQYNTHSFRIGRVTELANNGASDQVIRTTGRWKSTAYMGYIRPGNFNLQS